MWITQGNQKLRFQLLIFLAFARVHGILNQNGLHFSLSLVLGEILRSSGIASPEVDWAAGKLRGPAEVVLRLSLSFDNLSLAQLIVIVQNSLGPCSVLVESLDT